MKPLTKPLARVGDIVLLLEKDSEGKRLYYQTRVYEVVRRESDPHWVYTVDSRRELPRPEQERTGGRFVQVQRHEYDIKANLSADVWLIKAEEAEI